MSAELASRARARVARQAAPALPRRGVWLFGALLVLALVAFWPSYFAAPRVDARAHVHGIAMFLLVAIMAAQGALIRFDRRSLHRALGRTTYALVPFIAVSTVWLQHDRVRALDAEALYFLWVVLGLLAVFLVAFALAIRNRSRPAVHGRYMVGAALALVDPIFARLLHFNLGVAPPLMQAINYGLVDVFLLLLILRDWREEARLRAFPLLLGLFVVMQVPTFFIPGTGLWRSFAEGFAALPLP